MSENSNFMSGPQYMRKDTLYASSEDISRLRQRMLNLEIIIKELQEEIQHLKDK